MADFELKQMKNFCKAFDSKEKTICELSFLHGINTEMIKVEDTFLDEDFLLDLLAVKTREIGNVFDAETLEHEADLARQANKIRVGGLK